MPDSMSHWKKRKNNEDDWWYVGSVDEEDSGAGQGGEGVGHFADSGIVDKSSEEEQEAQHQEHPPQPVLSIKVTREVCGEPDYEDPFDEGESKAWDGPVSSGCRGGQTERQEETDPVE